MKGRCISEQGVHATQENQEEKNMEHEMEDEIVIGYLKLKRESGEFRDTLDRFRKSGGSE